MLVYRLTKETGDVSRVTVDFTTDVPFLDVGETISTIVNKTVTLGTPGWSSQPPSSVVPYDPTPLVLQSVTTVVGTAGANTAVQVFLNSGTPGNVYTVQMILVGTSGRHFTIEIAVQLAGTPPVPNPFPSPPIGSQPGYLPLSGGTLTGPLYASEDPLTSTEVVTKNYVDSLIGTNNVTNETTRATAAEATLTTNLATTNTNLATTNTNLTAEATRATAAEATLTTNLANEITRATAAEAANAVLIGHSLGRNYLHNALFNIEQRGIGPFTTSGFYTADRWQMSFVSDTMSVALSPLSDTARSQIGDETAESCLQCVFTTAGTAGSSSAVLQKVEDVRRLGNKTITVSFWAQASGAIRLAVSAVQWFGTGGSPSTSVSTPGAFVTLATTWARYSVTFTLPSTSGKTLGSNNDDSTFIDFFTSCGATNTNGCGMGTQSGTINLWGMQLELGSTVTPLEHRDPETDWQLCRRFYQTAQVVIGGYGVTGAGVGQSMAFQTPMRATPTLTSTGTANSNVSSFALNNIGGSRGVWANGTVTATGSWSINVSLTAAADL